MNRLGTELLRAEANKTGQLFALLLPDKIDGSLDQSLAQVLFDTMCIGSA
jgi:hypothetical protein